MIYPAGKTIGPAFPYELQAAGLLGLPFTWGTDGVFAFDDHMTPAGIDAVKAVIAAHNPVAPVQPGQITASVLADLDNQKLVKAIVLMLLTELNTIRAALVPPLPPVTAAQLRTEIATIVRGL